ncbi:J domain-containing protein [Anabaena subtropica]|uniref:J domain-containing protein n=1 Tax=Anabaena subtropica FACHB-260 TaxID=2692884 RepID=A0ABR8CN95_9NOST|nr:J domain-containing protein [Anabaena subtropica]MBD2344499.1 J domain-containing protein [Anabaena subtropica FACHB-260]
MSLRIDRGLFKYDFIDHHAILCVSVDADVKEIRKRYLKIARHLHPDSSAITTESEKKLASELLSKLVNPAYETLSAERTRSEYMIVLSQMGKRLVQESASIELNTDLAKQLASAPNIDHLYKSAIAKIAETQYNSLKEVIPAISQISELNLVYLMRTAGKALAAPPPAAKPIVNSTPPPPNATSAPPSPEPPKEDANVENYLRRAQSLIDKNQFASAEVELKDALKIAPKSSRGHSSLAFVYLKQNKLKMAKIHFDNALKLDPKDQTALTWKPKIDKALGQQSSSPNANSPSSTGNKQPDKSGGGLFGGLFGGKKK